MRWRAGGLEGSQKAGVAEAEGAGPPSNGKRRGPLELPGGRREVSWEGQCSRQAPLTD